MPPPAQGQRPGPHVRAAAGGAGPPAATGVQGRQPEGVVLRRPRQDVRRALLDKPQALPSAPVEQVGVLHLCQKRQQRRQRPPLRQDSGGPAGVGKSCQGFSPRAGGAVARAGLLAVGGGLGRDARRRQGSGGFIDAAPPGQDGGPGRYEQAEGVDCAPVGVHAACGGQHGRLRLQPGPLEGGHTVFPLQAQLRRAAEIGLERPRRAVEEGQVHVGVGAAAAPVHQTGLRRQIHLLQQSLHPVLRQTVRRKGPQERFRRLPDGREAVGAAAGAGPRRAAAHKAGPGLGAGELPPSGLQHVQVVEAGGGMGRLQGHGQGLQLRSGQGAGQDRLQARGRVSQLLAEERGAKGLPKPVQHVPEREINQPGTLHRARNIHGHPQEGLAVRLQQALLRRRTGVPGRKDLR